MSIETAIHQQHFRSEFHKMAVNILYTAGWIESLNIKVLKQYGLTPQQYNVLRILRGQKGKTINVQSIGTRMLDKSSNASRLIDKLTDKKLITREICPADRRQVEIVITQKGLELLSIIDAPIEATEKQFNCLTEKEARNLNQLLDKLRND